MCEVYIGCDTHKRHHSICIMNESGKELASFTISNNQEGFEKALKEAEKYENRLWGIENSANYAKHFRSYLYNNQEKLKEINPVYTSRKRNANTKRAKTDDIDALTIAKVLRDEQNNLPTIVVDLEREEITLILKERENVIKDRTRCKNRLHAKLIDIDSSYKDKIKRLDTLKALAKTEELVKKDKTLKSKFALEEIKQIKQLNERCKELDKLLLDKVKEMKILQNLCTVKGIGLIRACELYSQIGTLKEFKNNNNLASYAGIAPIPKSSGSYYRMCKNQGGNKKLKKIFKDIVIDWIRGCEESKKYYDKKIKEGKKPAEVKRCLMRKVVKILWMIIKYNQPYNYPKTAEFTVSGATA